MFLFLKVSASTASMFLLNWMCRQILPYFEHPHLSHAGKLESNFTMIKYSLIHFKDAGDKE